MGRTRLRGAKYGSYTLSFYVRIPDWDSCAIKEMHDGRPSARGTALDPAPLSYASRCHACRETNDRASLLETLALAVIHSSQLHASDPR